MPTSAPWWPQGSTTAPPGGPHDVGPPCGAGVVLPEPQGQRGECRRPSAGIESRPPEAPDPGTFLFRGPSTECESSWFTIKCKCGRRHVEMGSCQKEDCTRCGPAVAARRTKRTVSRFMQRPRGTVVCYSVFTVPPRLRHLCTKAVWRQARRAMLRILRDEFALLYGCDSTHPTGDDLEVFHPHLNVLWVRRPPFVGRLPRWQLQALKDRWADVLGDVVGDRPGHVVVRHDPKPRTKKKLSGLVYYVMRTFPGWSHWTGYRVRWYRGRSGGERFKVPAPVAEVWKCPDCGDVLDVCWLGDRPSRPILSSPANRGSRARSPPAT